ncbi:glyoxalase family protein [Verrucomicrobiia bacterium DG1235]|nr:glyoxalase family protein [Verrucomicrobiae bacterium DG1235]
MKAKRIFETILYAEDLPAAKLFYRDTLGLELMRESELVLVFRLQDSVLLVFDPRKSSPPGRAVPSHGTSGEGHIAFAATDEEIREWRVHLESKGIEIESVVEWGEGGESLYVRDPAGNSVEFAPSTLWGGGWDFAK